MLWVPCTIAGILMLTLGRLEEAEIHWVLNFFATQHSALGVEVPSSDGASVQIGAVMVTYSVGYLKQFLEGCLFVVALAVTSNLVRSIVEGQSPDMAVALREVKPQGWEVLLFTVKYMLILAVVAGVLIALSGFSQTSNHFHELLSSKVIRSAYRLVGEGFLAWVLLPAAIRLLRPPDSPAISAQGTKLGVLAAVTTSMAALALKYLVGKSEAAFVIHNQWESWAINVINTVILNAPQVFLFITLAMLASQGLGEERRPRQKQSLSW